MSVPLPESTDLPDESVPLSKAVIAFTPPAMLNELAKHRKAAAGQCRVVGPPRWFGPGYRGVYDLNPPIAAGNELEAAIVDDFRRKLRSGELVATGYRYPVGPDDQRRVVPAEKWDFLRPNWDVSSAEGGGLKFVQILVHAAKIHEAAATPITSVDLGAVLPPRKPGRPSHMGPIREELDRRFTEGRQRSSWKQEVRELYLWGLEHFGGSICPAESTIRNHLRKSYRRLEGIRSGPLNSIAK